MINTIEIEIPPQANRSSIDQSSMSAFWEKPQPERGS